MALSNPADGYTKEWARMPGSRARGRAASRHCIRLLVHQVATCGTGSVHRLGLCSKLILRVCLMSQQLSVLLDEAVEIVAVETSSVGRAPVGGMGAGGSPSRLSLWTLQLQNPLLPSGQQ